MDNDKILTNIFCKIFKINKSKILNVKFNTNNWDSIAHINLILEIESSFKIKIDIKFVHKINSFENTKKILSKFYGISFL